MIVQQINMCKAPQSAIIRGLHPITDCGVFDFLIVITGSLQHLFYLKLKFSAFAGSVCFNFYDEIPFGEIL